MAVKPNARLSDEARQAAEELLSDEARQAIAEAEAEENSASIEQEFAALADADPFSPENLANPLAMPASLAHRSQPTKGGRSEAQLAVDKVVETVHTAWVHAGKPSTWPDQVAAGCVAGYWFPATQVDALKKMITKAGTLFNYHVKYGTLAVRTDDMPQDGKVFVSYVVIDRRPRTI